MLQAEPVHSRNLPSGPVSDALTTHHREIEAACLEIMAAGYTDDPRDLTLRWRVIERELLAHMATEEQLLLPAYERAEPEIAQALRADHAALRARAMELAVAIQLHAVRVEQLRAFVDALRAHAAREETSLYLWTQANLPLDHDHRRRLLALVHDH
jgi:hemerythrin superfamily protein